MGKVIAVVMINGLKVVGDEEGVWVSAATAACAEVPGVGEMALEAAEMTVVRWVRAVEIGAGTKAAGVVEWARAVEA